MIVHGAMLPEIDDHATPSARRATSEDVCPGARTK
jgi:hypothetical protein